MPRAVIPSITDCGREKRGEPVLDESRARWSARRTSNATFCVEFRFASCDSSILSQCRVTSRSCGSYDAKVK